MELVRHPLALVEPSAARSDELIDRFAGARRVRSVSGLGSARRLLDAPLAGWILAPEIGGRSASALAKKIRQLAPRIPIFVVPPRCDPDVNAWCRTLGASYLPGELDASDVAFVLDEAEQYETASVSSLAWVVRRASPERLLPHEARLLTAFLDGAREEDLPDVLAMEPPSCASIKSRALAKVRVRQLDQLRQARRVARARFGAEGDPPWWRA
jgi:hypothetical protein